MQWVGTSSVLAFITPFPHIQCPEELSIWPLLCRLSSSAPAGWSQGTPDSLPQCRRAYKGVLGQRDSSLGRGHQPGRASGRVLEGTSSSDGGVQTVPTRGSIWAKIETQSSCVGSWRCKRLVPDAASGLPFLGPACKPVQDFCVCKCPSAPPACLRVSNITCAHLASSFCLLLPTCFCQEIFSSTEILFGGTIKQAKNELSGWMVCRNSYRRRSTPFPARVPQNQV